MTGREKRGGGVPSNSNLILFFQFRRRPVKATEIGQHWGYVVLFPFPLERRVYISSSFSFLFLDHQHEGLYNTFQVPGSTPSDFKKLILSPGVKTEREETLERTSKVLENYQNSFLAISVFVTQMTNCCRKMNESYRDIFFGCKNSCPIHCVHEKAVKVRPGKFKMWPKRSASAADGGGGN